MRRLLISLVCLSLLIVLVGPTAAREQPPIDDSPRHIGLQHPDWFERSLLDLREDLENVRAQDKRGLMIYVGMDHCPYCEALFTVNFAAPDILAYTREHFNVVGLDILGSRELTDLDGVVKTERQYGIEKGLNFTPALLFYDQEGEAIFRLRGYHPPYRFRAALEFVADGHYENESFRDYLARADPPPRFDVTGLNDQAFFQPGPHRFNQRGSDPVRPLIVFFEQGECHACDILHTEPLNDPAVQQLLSQFDVVQLDMWSDEVVVLPDGRTLSAEAWAAELGLYYAPTLVFFDASGEEVIRIDSVVRQHRLHAVMEYMLTEGYRSHPTFQRWRAEQDG